ncbi:MAG: Re/Si-specific NAD(P)(+) transhydrogenase subunit alpha [Nitrospinota bacterium]
MIVGIPKETFPGERRVAIIPAAVPALMKAGLEIHVESGAGDSAGFPDPAYQKEGAHIVPSHTEVFKNANVILQVRAVGANPEAGRFDIELMRQDQIIIGFLDPLTFPESVKEISEKGVTAFALELIPRISRAQSMDALSSMASIAGYKAVLLAAERLPKIFPMLMTAAGTIAPARVFVVGAGVAGLQAIATSRRLGAVVEGYDVRPAVKQEVESLGAKFIEMPIDVTGSQDTGGYAKALGEEFYRRQREMMSHVVSRSDAVITTAAVPGKKAPILISREMVSGMMPGSVIVDLAAERGGNCELVHPDEIIEEKGVTILGPVNLPSTVPYHASQLYSKNISTFLLNLIKQGRMDINLDDVIIRDTLIVQNGKIVHPRILEIYKEGVAAPHINK